MLKPEQLRTALTHALSALQTHPDKLRINLDNGRVVSTLGASLSFEYQYQLNLTLSDQVAEEDLVMVTVLAWLRSHQPDILANTEKRKNGFAFKRDVSAAGQLELQLQLTERIQVEQRDGALHIIPLAEPPVPENVIRFTQVYLHGDLISQFQQP